MYPVFLLGGREPLPAMAEVKKNLQRELDPLALQKKAKEVLPPRGTGRKTGTAKKPSGPSGRLTEEERKKRHKEQTK